MKVGPGEVEDDRRVFEELSFSRLIVVPLFFIDFVGVRKENERLTAIPSELFQKLFSSFKILDIINLDLISYFFLQ